MNCPKCETEAVEGYSLDIQGRLAESKSHLVVPMEIKVQGHPLNTIIGGNTLTIYQCPRCKNIEVR